LAITIGYSINTLMTASTESFPGKNVLPISTAKYPKRAKSYLFQRSSSQCTGGRQYYYYHYCRCSVSITPAFTAMQAYHSNKEPKMEANNTWWRAGGGDSWWLLITAMPCLGAFAGITFSSSSRNEAPQSDPTVCASSCVVATSSYSYTFPRETGIRGTCHPD